MMLSRSFVRESRRFVSVAMFSSDCGAAEKLRCVFEEYRQQHYSRETPRRFKHEMVKAVTSEEGTIQVDRLNQFLENIGRSDQTLSREEFQMLSDGRSALTASQVLQLV